MITFTLITVAVAICIVNANAIPEHELFRNDNANIRGRDLAANCGQCFVCPWCGQCDFCAAIKSDSAVQVEPSGCNAECLDSLRDAKDAIVFTPQNDPSPKQGLLLYAGNNLDPRSYGIVAREVAAEGYFVALVPFPQNKPMEDSNRALSIIAKYPSISEWAIAGHSDAGTAACKFVADNESATSVKALLLLAAGCESDISNDDTTRVYAVTATADGKYPANEFAESKAMLPSDQTTYLEIRGGNHAQFAHDAPLASNDKKAGISQDEQRRLVVAAAVHLMQQLSLSPTETTVSEAYKNIDNRDSCQSAQLYVGNFNQQDLNITRMRITVHNDAGAAGDSKAEFNPVGADGALIMQHLYVPQVPNLRNPRAPAFMESAGLFCKSKNQNAWVDEFEFQPAGEPEGCEKVAELVFENALSRVSQQVKTEFLEKGIQVEFVTDNGHFTGFTWFNSKVKTTAESETMFKVTSHGLYTAPWIPGGVGGVQYCKYWSTQQAVEFIESFVFAIELPRPGVDIAESSISPLGVAVGSLGTLFVVGVAALGVVVKKKVIANDLEIASSVEGVVEATHVVGRRKMSL